MWAMHDSGYCRHHQDGDANPSAGSWQTSLPSTLPDITETQLHQNEKAIKEQIKRRKASRERKAQKDKERALKNAGKATDLVIKSAGLQPIGDTSLRTLEDCLGLIEYAVDEVLDMPASISKSKTLIQAARTAGQLIIQAGVADKAVDWFMENVKLVANIDLDQI
jgi:hypothetical protein